MVVYVWDKTIVVTQILTYIIIAIVTTAIIVITVFPEKDMLKIAATN
jgi:hypothetical protein